MKSVPNASFNSPCVRNCCLDDNEICIGCYRSIDEIRQWGSMSEKEKGRAIVNIKARQIVARKQKGGV